jgi:acetyl esterase
LLVLDSATVELLERVTRDIAQGGMTRDPSGRLDNVMSELLAKNGHGPAMDDTRDIMDPSDPSIRLRVLRPVPSPRGVVVYFHSGGWLTKSIEDAEPIARRLAERTACTFALVDYRPAGQQQESLARRDALESWQWVCDHTSSLGVAGKPVIAMGAGLGAKLCQDVARRSEIDADRTKPSLQVLVDPVLRGPGQVTASEMGSPTNGISALLDRSMMRYHLNDVSESPRTTPTLVVLGGDSPFRGDGESYVETLRSAQVPAELRIHSGQMHGFFDAVAVRQGERAFQQVIRVVRAVCSRAERLQTHTPGDVADLLALA